MLDTDFFKLLYHHLDERQSNNIYENVLRDINYLKATELEKECYKQYENLILSAEQKKLIGKWIDAIQTQNSAYTAVAFQLGMPCCFSLLLELVDLK